MGILRIAVLVVLLPGLPGAAHAAVTVYPVQRGVMDINTDFVVRVNGVDVPVQDSYFVCFAHFAMSGRVDVEVTVNGPIPSYRLSPLSRGIDTARNGNVIRFTLTRPEKLILEIGDIGDQAIDGLLILADAPERSPPSLDDPAVRSITDWGVDDTGGRLETVRIQKALDDLDGLGQTLYFPSGVYRTGEIYVRSDTAVYLAPGAVILGSTDFGDYDADGDGQEYLIGARNASNVRLYGRGMVNARGTTLRAAKDSYRVHLLQPMGSRGVTVEGVILLDPASWNVEFIHCDDVTVRNVKVINNLRFDCRNVNTDGIDPNRCRKVLIADTLIWASDDAIAVKSDRDGGYPTRDCDGLRVDNCVLFTRKCGLRIGTETLREGYRMHDYTFENVDIVQADRAIAIYAYEGMAIEDIRYRNIRIEKVGLDFDTGGSYKKALVFFEVKDRGYRIRNIRLDNVSAREHSPKNSEFRAVSDTKNLFNVHFSNYAIGGTRIDSLSDARITLKRGANAPTFGRSARRAK